MKRAILLAAVALLTVPLVIHGSSIDFVSGGPGSWSFSGLGGLTATGNTISVNKDGVPPTYALAGQVLTITTGAFMGGTGSLLNPFVWGSGGSIVITDGVTSDLVASFTSASAAFVTGGPGLNFNGNFIAGTVDQSILTLLLFPAGTPTDVTGSLQALLNGTPGGLSNTYQSGNISVTPVPEPATLTLLGTGLIGIAALVRRSVGILIRS